MYSDSYPEYIREDAFSEPFESFRIGVCHGMCTCRVPPPIVTGKIRLKKEKGEFNFSFVRTRTFYDVRSFSSWLGLGPI